ncbi:MAG: site-specific integrase [Planctomycetota bacterium]|jgi:integrase/recombinase XerC
MKDSAIVQEFLSYLKFEKRFSEHTAKCYEADLRQFGEYLIGASVCGHSPEEPMSLSHSKSPGAGPATAVATHPDVKIDQLLLSVETAAVRAYLAFLNEKQYSKATIARKLATLRSFYKFLVKRSQLGSNPVAAVRTPKQEKKLPKFLEYEEVKRLLETPPMNSWLGARDRAILETLYSTGTSWVRSYMSEAKARRKELHLSVHLLCRLSSTIWNSGIKGRRAAGILT